MAKISVIIPVYNDSVYVQRCLDKLINQTFSDLEIIVVDDGSTDNTPQVLEDYAKKDNRIKVIHQTNAKLGAARNTGMNIATGDYISFIDSDDWVDENYYEAMYNAISEENSDMAVSSSIREKASGKFTYCLRYDEKKTYTDKDEIIKVLQMPPYWFVWGRLYKKDLIKDLRFEEGVFFEDAPYTIKVIDRINSITVVPDVKYHYFSNPNSILKSKNSIAKDMDKVNSMLNTINYIKEHNLNLKEITIYKDRHLLYTTKYYGNRKEFYLFGIKIYTKYEEFDNSKVFVIFNTACFGDVLVCNTLCQNIKMAYPNSKVVFVVDKPFYDAAKCQKDVDDVIVYDKKGIHKGFRGIRKFIKEFPYKKPFASFNTYGNARNTTIANGIGSKYVVVGKRNRNIPMQEAHTLLFKEFTNKNLQNFPIKCFADENLPEHIKELMPQGNKYIALCVLTKNPPKDMPFLTAVDLIDKINKSGYKPVLVGTGDKTVKYANELENTGCKFINLVNKTTIPELGSVLKNCTALISVDTGTMHYGYALGVPTTAVFYETITLNNWTPNPNIYNTVLVKSNQTAENIFDKTQKLIDGTLVQDRKNIAICFGCDNNYVQHMGATMSSILKHKQDDEFIKFYVLDGGISVPNKEKLSYFEKKYLCSITYVQPNMEELKNCCTYKGDYISLATYYRLLIPELIPNEDRILYLDCDIIVRKSLSDLYNRDFGNNMVYGVVDCSVKEHSVRLGVSKYINAGVLLLNCKKMREENSVQTIIDWIGNNQDKIECHDQDVINAVFDGRIEYVEDIYNAQVKKLHDTIFSKIKDPAILHFISPKKPWVHWKPLNSTPWAVEYFKALKGTPWADFVKKYMKKALWMLPLRLFYPYGITRKIVRWIFSLTNTPDRQYKLLRILGITFKFKKHRVVNEK